MPGSRSFFEAGLEEDEMLAALTADGYRITARTLRRLWCKLGFLRRLEIGRAIDCTSSNRKFGPVAVKPKGWVGTQPKKAFRRTQEPIAAGRKMLGLP